MLEKQFHLYSIDTGHFYSNREKYWHDQNCKYRQELIRSQKKLSELEKELKQLGYSAQTIKQLKNKQTADLHVIDNSKGVVSKYLLFAKAIKHKQEKIKRAKENLLALLANKIKQNQETNGADHVRAVRERDLNDTNIISVFDSALGRSIGVNQDQLTDALIVVQIYYFDIFKDISFYGFLYKGEKYRYYTSSAGQIRAKKAMFIKESVWNQIEQTLMCGLTIDKINAKGGNNVNKHLAYLALANSATDEWKGFDIDRSIVIDDFETNVYGTFDFVDDADYSITRKTDYAPIPHTDGAGMILPSVSQKNFMFRAPWIKGLLGVFDFQKFITEHGCSPIITDIYGQKHDILKENIEIIFTKSQFKMHQYYESWQEYKSLFKKNQCCAGVCNVEEERIKWAKINYQMLQTLTDVSDEEIDLLTQKSADKIRNICLTKDTMMEALGITCYNEKLSAFQQAVKLYPALLNDAYTKDILRDVKDSLVKKYRSGKLEINGKYVYLLPDFYAACEYWFLQNKNPKGLLADQEIFCWLFKQNEKLDCLRSPHLYKEHAVRTNVASHAYETRKNKIRAWFTTNGLYTSSHDLISKLLMFDVDGDKSLVVADQTFIKIAERNMQGIVPLYYNMRKAKPTKLSNETIYNGLNAAFTGGNIGVYSNHISKIWNDDVFQSGTDKEKQHAINCVKMLCCQNNFVIDYAKTLYKPEFPEEIKKQISHYTNAKLPAFFEFAKDKEKSQLNKRNGSFVNKLFDKIPNQPINARHLQLEDIVYQKMMSDDQTVCCKEAAVLYNKLNKQYRYMVHTKDEGADNLRYITCKIKEQFRSLGYSDETIADMLIEYLYGGEKRYKHLFWFCYGDYAVKNLEKNLHAKKTNYIQCADCDAWIEIDAKDHSTTRCPTCYTLYRKKYKALKERLRRLKSKNMDKANKQ